MASETIPGAWAPSTSVSMPRSASSRTRRSTGRTSPVGLVTWLMTAKPRPGRDPVEERLRELVRSGGREGERRDDERRAVACGGRLEGRDRGVVLVVVGQQLVARREPQRPEDRVHRGRRVRDERQPVGIGAQERPEDAADVVERSFELAIQEAHGRALQAVAPAPLHLEHLARRRAERAMI